MSFIENYSAYVGQDAGVGGLVRLLLDSHVGEEEMVVHDDDVALHRPAAHFGDETSFPLAAFLAGTGFGAGVELVPEGAGFGQFGEFGAVSGLGYFFPASDGAVLLDLVKAAEYGLSSQVVEFLAAYVVAAPLHVADVQLAFAVGVESLFEERDVFVEELFLEIFRARRDDDALAGTNHGHQIRQSFSGACSSFHDEVALLCQSLLYGLGHLKLATAEFVGGVGF